MSRSSRAFVLASAYVALTACTSGTQAGSPAGKETALTGAPALEISFRLMTPGSDSQSMVDVDAIVQSGKVHVSRVGYPGKTATNPSPATTFTYDGSRLLIHDPENGVPYQLIEDAAHASDPNDSRRPALADVAPFLPFDPTTATSQLLCLAAKQLQEGTDLGRAARKYSCSAAGGGPATIWIDKAFGVELSPLLPSDTKFLANPHVDATTFSTTPPTGAGTETLTGNKLKAGDRAPGFTITEVPSFTSAAKSGVGRPISSTEFAGRPYVVAFFGDGLVFGGDGPEAMSLRSLNDLTNAGTTPKVLGVLETASDFVDKGGVFASKGWHFPVGYENSRVQHQFGFTDQVDFGFVNSDGTISSLHSGPMGAADLRVALGNLK